LIERWLRQLYLMPFGFVSFDKLASVLAVMIASFTIKSTVSVSIKEGINYLSSLSKKI